jgi:hypothetical protein
MNRLLYLLRRPARPGQTIVIVALAMLVLIALVGLAVDGGSALLQRRNMQNAADAGALGAAQMMQANMAVSCGDNNGLSIACHPTYTIFNSTLLARVNQLLQRNRGGELGPATYGKTVEYHVVNPAGGSGYVPADSYAPQDLVPAWADGVRVTATINNPTTLAHAINVDFIPVQAAAATRLYATSAPPVTPGPSTLPITRYRPDVENKMTRWSNELCNPFPFWDLPGSAFPGPVITLQGSSQYDGTNQPLSGLDNRRGTSGGLGNYDRADTPPHERCPPLSDCADMLNGSATPTLGVQNWIFWQWQGLISPLTWWPQDPIKLTLGTPYPSDRLHPNGAGGQARQGDWAETYPNPDPKINPPTLIDVQDIAHDLLYAPNAYDTPISPPEPEGLNWGKAVDLNLSLWGGPTTALPDTLMGAQKWMVSVPVPPYPPGCGGLPPSPPCAPPYTGWEDLQVTDSSGALRIQSIFCATGCGIDYNQDRVRVRFTRTVRFRIYVNLEGRGETYPLTQPFAPTRCTIAFQPTGVDGTVWGLFMQQPVPGPQPGEFGGAGLTTWAMGQGVYLRVIDP